MSLPPELLIATGNRGKSAEISVLLSDLPLMLRDLSHFGISTDIEETGNTFAENAELKAVGYALLAGIPAIADDSGLVVDALDGRPGVHSARYAGAEASDEARINKLLGELKYVSIERSTARFICTVALADSTQKVHGVVYGVCEGTIVDAPRGELGFGYDPIFQPHGFEQTFGELESEIKNRISHRGLAFQKIVPFLRGFFKL